MHAQPRIKLNNYPFLGLKCMYRGNNDKKSAALNEAFNGPLNFLKTLFNFRKVFQNGTQRTRKA